MIKHLASQEYFQVEDGGHTFIVRKHTLWQEGEESWKVSLEENGLHKEVKGEQRNTVIKMVQNHLVRR